MKDGFVDFKRCQSQIHSFSGLVLGAGSGCVLRHLMMFKRLLIRETGTMVLLSMLLLDVPVLVYNIHVFSDALRQK